MGATTFSTVAHGETARAAFSSARSEAQYDCGHGGYTGTIAEKDSFKEFPVPAGLTAQQFADLLEDFSPDDDVGRAEIANPQYTADAQQAVLTAFPTYDDKWGPAVCLKIEEGVYLFCGYASC